MRALFLIVSFVCAAAWAADVPNNLPSSRRNTTAAYNPSNDLTGMIAWYNPDALSGNDGDAIVSYTDMSGNGNHLIQTENTSRRAILKRNIVNGRSTTRANTVTGMYRDGLALPADIAVFWAVSNSTSLTMFDHGSGWWVGNLFANNRMIDFPGWSGDGKKASAGAFNIFSLVSTSDGQVYREYGVPLTGWKNSKSAATARLMLFANDSYAYNAVTDFGEFLIYSNSTMTAARRIQIERYYCTKYNQTYGTTDGKIRVYCDGDSITYGGGINTEPGGDDSWPARLRAGIGSAYEVVNVGVSAQTLQNMTNDAPVQTYPMHGDGTNILFVWEYANSTGLGDAGMANTISNYCINAMAAGWPKNRIIVASDFHASCTNAGNIVQANYAVYAGHFIDLNLASLRADSATFGDNLHLTSAGWQIVANAVSNVIKTAIYP
jgi:lysophospholipase L1-like esterase